MLLKKLISVKQSVKVKQLVALRPKQKNYVDAKKREKKLLAMETFDRDLLHIVTESSLLHSICGKYIKDRRDGGRFCCMTIVKLLFVGLFLLLSAITYFKVLN